MKNSGTGRPGGRAARRLGPQTRPSAYGTERSLIKGSWRRRSWVLVLVWWAGVCFGQAGVGTVTLSGKVTGGSGTHPIHVALWDGSGFPDKPVREIRLEPGAATDFRFEVPHGRWALSAYEDVNENGKLDMGVFGPKEPSGFWRAFHAWRKPRFDDVAVEVDRDMVDVEIRIGGK
jgi:hypothetical protein